MPKTKRTAATRTDVDTTVATARTNRYPQSAKFAGLCALLVVADPVPRVEAQEAAVEELPAVTVETAAEPKKQRKYPKAPTAKPVKVKSVPVSQPAPQPAASASSPSGESAAAAEGAEASAGGSGGAGGARAIAVTGDIVGDRQGVIDASGSAAVIEAEELYTSHIFTTNEALRKVPGIHIRDEEGFGIRPNIGIRGLNPTRSTKTLLLEDGLFLTYAPYGDNASYFHPSSDRFDHIEVIKGADQLLYGPQTISGTINYVTPNPPEKPSGFVAATGGSRDYFNGQVFYGGWFGNMGGLADYVHKEGKGSRDNTEHRIEDFGVKGIVQMSPEAALIAKASYFTEDSQVTYSGLTDAEYRNFGQRYNPFDNDTFETERYATSLTLNWDINRNVNSKTSVYWSWFSRDWWRQASTTTDGQCGAAFVAARAAGQAVDPDQCNSTQGRLRDYYHSGIDQRWTYQAEITDLVRNELKVGWRMHTEEQDRQQKNGTFAQARTGLISELNERNAKAFSLFAENRIDIGAFSITPIIRFEDIDYERVNRLAASGCVEPPCRGDAEVSEFIPGITFAYQPTKDVKLFAGVHEGFAPPRVEDSILQDGGSVDVDGESSVNLEVGVKSELARGIKLDATYFRNDFHNLIAVGSIAGGSVNLAQGEALFEGLELYSRVDTSKAFNTPLNFYGSVAWTYLWTAEQSTPFLRVDNGLPVTDITDADTTGNRQPYAPEHLVTARLGYSQRNLDAHIEMVYVGEQFADFQNFASPAQSSGVIVSGVDRSLTGLFGEIDAYTIFNLGVTYTYEPTSTDVFFSVKNLFDEDYITDRTRGILPGTPQLVHFGLKQAF
ncbi:MAG: TonB-dependent receptor plug domain-containing protein [Hyphomicrobium sp.]